MTSAFWAGVMVLCFAGAVGAFWMATRVAQPRAPGRACSDYCAMNGLQMTQVHQCATDITCTCKRVDQ